MKQASCSNGHGAISWKLNVRVLYWSWLIALEVSMRTVGTLEAKTRLSQLLNKVEAGERINIPRHFRSTTNLQRLRIIAQRGSH